VTGDVTLWYQRNWLNTRLVWARGQHEVGEASIFWSRWPQVGIMEKSSQRIKYLRVLSIDDARGVHTKI
jgi:hypothetical protein